MKKFYIMCVKMDNIYKNKEQIMECDIEIYKMCVII